jgi:integration host factor subunit alpha
MTLTKAGIAERVHEAAADLSLRHAAESVAATFEILKTALEAGEDVLITGFGKFTVRDKAARVGRNPKTGEPLTIEPRRVVSFKYSEALKDAVNSQGHRGPGRRG